jgi:hypothetical protein
MHTQPDADANLPQEIEQKRCLYRCNEIRNSEGHLVIIACIYLCGVNKENCVMAENYVINDDPLDFEELFLYNTKSID